MTPEMGLWDSFRWAFFLIIVYYCLVILESGRLHGGIVCRVRMITSGDSNVLYNPVAP